MRIATKKVIFVDICPTYPANRAMLSGEPYFLEYQQNIDSDLAHCDKRTELVKGKCVMWEFNL